MVYWKQGSTLWGWKEFREKTVNDSVECGVNYRQDCVKKGKKMAGRLVVKLCKQKQACVPDGGERQKASSGTTVRRFSGERRSEGSCCAVCWWADDNQVRLIVEAQQVCTALEAAAERRGRGQETSGRVGQRTAHNYTKRAFTLTIMSWLGEI